MRAGIRCGRSRIEFFVGAEQGLGPFFECCRQAVKHLEAEVSSHYSAVWAHASVARTSQRNALMVSRIVLRTSTPPYIEQNHIYLNWLFLR